MMVKISLLVFLTLVSMPASAANCSHVLTPRLLQETFPASLSEQARAIVEKNFRENPKVYATVGSRKYAVFAEEEVLVISKFKELARPDLHRFLTETSDPELNLCLDQFADKIIEKQGSVSMTGLILLLAVDVNLFSLERKEKKLSQIQSTEQLIETMIYINEISESVRPGIFKSDDLEIQKMEDTLRKDFHTNQVKFFNGIFSKNKFLNGSKLEKRYFLIKDR